nr:MAG TPA: hypothetical protein [Caudoviricetes sp.]
MEFDPSDIDLEQAHITLAELIANTKILFKATQLAQSTNKDLLKTYENLSNKFLDREKMVGYEMTELLDTLRALTKTIDKNPEQASNFNTQELSNALLDVLSRSGVSDTTKKTISRNYAGAMSQASGSEVDRSNLVNYVKTIADQMKSQARQAQLQARPALRMARNTDSVLDEIVHDETQTTLSQLAKKKAGRLSEGKMAGGISYVEGLFGVRGATDFVSDKMGSLFGFDNLKEKLLTFVGNSAKKLYGGIEKFLPDMFKLDERRFYALNQEIMFNAQKILDEIDNDMSRLLIKRDNDLVKLKKDLEAGDINLDEFNKKRAALDDKLDAAKAKLEKKRSKIQDEFDDALLSVSNVDFSGVAENLYSTIERNRRDMEADLAERMDRGIISDDEVKKSRANFALTEHNLKAGLKDAYVKKENFNLDRYIQEVTKATQSASLSEEQLTKLNGNFSEFLRFEKEKDRKDELNSDIFSKSDEDKKEDSDSGFKNNMKEQLEKKNDGDSLLDSLGDMLDGDGGGRRRRGRRRSRGKLKGAKPRGILGKAARLGRNVLGGVGSFVGGSTVGRVLSSGTSMVGKAGRGLMSVGKGAARLLGKAALPLAAIMAAKDGFDGWNNAASNFDLKEGQEATTGQKASSAVGGVVSGLTMGLVDEKKAAQTVHKIGSGIADFFGFGDKKEGENKEEETGFFSSLKDKAKKALEYSPLGLISKGVNKIMGVGEEKTPEEIAEHKKEMDKNDKMIELLEMLVDKNMIVNVTGGSSGGTSTPKRNDDLGIMMVNNGMIQ